MTERNHPIIVQPSFELHAHLSPIPSISGAPLVGLAFSIHWPTARRDGDAQPFRVVLDRAAIHRLRYALDRAEDML